MYERILRASVAILFVLLFSLRSVVGQTGENILREALQHNAESKVHSARLEFRVKTEMAVSEKQIAEAVARQRAAIELMVNEHRDNVQVRSIYEKALVGNDENVREQVVANATREIFGTFAAIGPPIGGDVYSETRVRRGQSKEWAPPTVLISRKLANNQFESVTFDQANRLCIVNEVAVAAGVVDPHYSGRLHGMVLQLLTAGDRKSMSPDLIVSDPEIGSFEGADAFSITVQFANESIRLSKIALMVVPTRGYICPEISLYDRQLNLVSSTKCSGYFLHGGSDLWFPERMRSELTGATRTDHSAIECRFDPKMASFNNAGEPPLAIQIASGVNISYQYRSDHGEYESTCPLNLRIDDLPTLPHLACVISAARPGENLKVLDEAKGTGTALILAFVVTVLLFFLWRSYRKGRFTAILLSFVASSFFGCSHQVSNATLANDPVLSMPSELPIGEISGTGQVVTVNFDVVNQSDRSHSIAISTSCGCVALARDKIELARTESAAIPLIISTLGRNGPFSSEITFAIDDGTRQTVQVQGVIRQQVFAIPSSLRLVQRETEWNGTLKISAPLETWPDLYVECSDPRVTTEIGEVDGELREFRIVTVADDASRNTCSVNVMRKGQAIPVLQVPMIFVP